MMDLALMRRLGPWIAVLAWIFGILLVLMLAVHAHFGEALSGFFNSAFGGRNLAYLMATLSRTTLIVGMALSSMFSFRAGLFNIGGEGQLVVGGMAAALVGVYLPGWGPLVLVCGIIAGMVAGAAWALLAGVMQSYLGVPLLIGSLLLNYPAAYIASYLVGHPFRDVASGLPQTFQVQASTWLPFIPGTRLDIGIIAILVVAIGAVIYANNTVAGYRARMNGLAPEFARASGLPVRPLLFQTLAISGAIAGLVGGLAVFGVAHRYTDGMLVAPLYAWTGIIAVLLVGMVPWAVPISGFFFAAVETGAAGMERTANVPQQVALIMQAVIILFVAGRISGASLVHGREDGDGL
jgi:simple sugar transport system permease protein